MCGLPRASSNQKLPFYLVTALFQVSCPCPVASRPQWEDKQRCFLRSFGNREQRRTLSRWQFNRVWKRFSKARHGSPARFITMVFPATRLCQLDCRIRHCESTGTGERVKIREKEIEWLLWLLWLQAASIFYLAFVFKNKTGFILGLGYKISE